MSRATAEAARGTAVVTGASGQDGWFLTRALLREGATVVACTRTPAALPADQEAGEMRPVTMSLEEPEPLFEIIRRERPAEVFHLAGVSSVARSFADPDQAWTTNATFVERLLECIRLHSPETRLYQASSTEVFGGSDDPAVVYDETSALDPRSPYAAAKAAAQLLVSAYRESFGLRIACGILSNHESSRRPASFLTRKVVDHVLAVAAGSTTVLRLGNVRIERDWGHAADYTSGILSLARQTRVRSLRSGTAVPDTASNYCDYVLSTGRTHAIWHMVDRAFALAGLDLVWSIEGNDPREWRATFERDGAPAVIVDPSLIRPSERRFLRTSCAKAVRELGWNPRPGVDSFLQDMLGAAAVAAVSEGS